MEKSTRLRIPLGDVEIQEVGGVQYLVARLSSTKSGKEYVAELKRGQIVVVPVSMRAHLSGLLKKQGIFTRYRTVVPGEWAEFAPCAKRRFKA